MEKLAEYSMNILIMLRIQHAILALAKTDASASLLTSAILHRNETSVGNCRAVRLCLARDLLFEL